MTVPIAAVADGSRRLESQWHGAVHKRRDFRYNGATAAICERLVGCPPRCCVLPGNPIIDI
jgi:hypothetical protein